MRGDIFMIILSVFMIIFSITHDMAIAGSVWGVVLGLTIGSLIEEVFYWRVKRKARLYS